MSFEELSVLYAITLDLPEILYILQGPDRNGEGPTNLA